MSASNVDYYGVEELYSAEELLIRDSVRQWVADEVAPIIADCYQEGRFPAELIQPMARLGLLGAHLPTRYDCAGVSSVAYGLVMQELERCDSGVRSFASVQGSLCMFPIYTYGSEEQRQRWLPPMARGEVIGCFGLTEPDGGSDPLGTMRTRAVPDGEGGYVLSGSKMWITNGTTAHVAVIWAVTLCADGSEVVRGFLVEHGTPGFSQVPVHQKLSLRASDTAELVLDEVRLPAANVLPKALGLGAPLSCLTEARFGIAWGAVGAAMACYQEALEYTTDRVTFGSPIAAKQLVQEKLVWMLSEITRSQLQVWRLGRLKEQGTLRPPHVSLAKRDCVAMALACARHDRDILGAAGITAEFQAMRHMCNLESVYTYEGTHDIHTLIVGEDITGLRAF